LRRVGDPLTPREGVLAVLGGCVLALAMHWPLPLHLGRDIPKDLGDPIVQAWQVAWGGHALLHQPLDLFQANVFWPLRNTLAFSDALIGYAPAGVIGEGAHAAVVRYDLLFLLAYALAFAAPYLLARELGAGRAGAAVAGAAFAYAPWRLEQDGHLHVISSGGIPLSLFLLVRGYRGRRPGLVLAGWLVAAWQVSLGFTLGLQLVYVLAVVGAIAAVPWLARGRPPLGRGIGAATVAGVTALALTGIVLSRPYLEVRDDHSESRRTPATVSAFSGPAKQFLAASEQSLVWGEATRGVREDLPFVPEQTLFPGAVILALALVGLVASAYSRRLRAGLAVAVVALAVLSLGFKVPSHGTPYPYRLLYDHAPGWKAIRTPGRLNTLTSLGLALLAAGGAHELVTRVGRRRALAAGASAALVAAVLVEGSGFDVDSGVSGPPHPTVPSVPAGQLGAPAPQLHLPLYSYDSRKFVLWSTEGFPRIVNGRASFRPSLITRLEPRLRGFPDAESVAVVRSLGVRTVILHPEYVRGTPWEGWRSRPVGRLPLRREARDRVVLYRVTPSARSRSAAERSGRG
jgi:hypothetical protein